MKQKIFAIFLVLAITLGILPSHAQGLTTLEPSGVKLEYDFLTRSTSFDAPYYLGTSETTRSRDIRGITYEYTDGSWEWFGGSWDWKDATNTKNDSIAIWYSTRLVLRSALGNWLGLSIKIPKTGLYQASLKSMKSVSSGKADIYLVKKNVSTTEADVTAALNTDTYIGQVDFADTASTALTAAEDKLSRLEINEAGEYVIVFKQLASSRNYPHLLVSLTLDGINELKYLDCNLPDSMQLGESTIVQCEARRLDGVALGADDVKFALQSSDKRVVKCDGLQVRAMSEGSCEITVTATSGEIVVEKSVAITVTDNSGVESAAISIDNLLYIGEKRTLEFIAKYNSGNTAKISNTTFEITENPENAVRLENGVLYVEAAGSTTIRASAEFRGESYTDEVKITVSGNKMEPSGVKLEYDFTKRSGSFDAPYYSGTSETSRSRDIRGITYECTDGNWEWFGGSYDWKSSNASAIAYSNRLALRTPTGEWTGLTVNVPKPGLYSISLSSMKQNSEGSGVADIYLVPKAEGMTEADVTDALIVDNYFGQIDFSDGAFENTYEKADDMLGEFFVRRAGEYILVLKQRSLTMYYSHVLVSFTLDGVNNLKYIDMSIGNSSLSVGESAAVSYTASLLDGTIIPDELLAVKCLVENPAVAQFDDGIVTALGEGSTDITLAVSYMGTTARKSVSVSVEDKSGVASCVVQARDYIYEGGAMTLTLNALMNSGNALRIPNARYEIVSSNPENAARLEADILYAEQAGIIELRGIGEFKGGTHNSDAITIEIRSGMQKSAPTLYTEKMREIARTNVKNYTWAKREKDTYLGLAERYVENTEHLWRLFVGEGTARSRLVGVEDDPDYQKCRYCGVNILEKYGGYEYDCLAYNWKIRCPDCRRVFPSNDFEGFYKLGVDESGVFDVARAHTENDILISKGEDGFLKNILYPEVGEKFGDSNWGVDDGFGYDTGRVYPNGASEVHTYIPYYVYNLLGTERSAITNCAFSYMLTGELKYGRTAAILLDRFADLYPDFDLYKFFPQKYQTTDGLSGCGKIWGSILDAIVAEQLSDACDILYPMCNDSEVISFLSARAKEKKLENEKLTGADIWRNWRDNILIEMYDAAKTARIAGNFGMKQVALAKAAIVLDEEPISGEIMDFVYRTGDTYPTKKLCTGGNVLSQLVDIVDRDGMGNEASVNYNSSWTEDIIGTAEAAELYHDKAYSLYQNPKFVQMFTAMYTPTLLNSYSAQIGDSGATASNWHIRGSEQYVKGFRHLRDTSAAKKIATFIYTVENFKIDNLHYDIYTENPESIQDEIRALVNEGEGISDSDMMTGFGFAVARDGKNYESVGIGAAKNTMRDMSVYFGQTQGHGHKASLNLGIDSFGHQFLLDRGYPANTGSNPNRLQWVSATISHNTVLVDGENQKTMTVASTPLHFDDSGHVKLIDIDASAVYDQTREYRRSVVMVKASEDVSYYIDFFKVTGGKSHAYMVHPYSNSIAATEGLALVKQADENGYIGSYAGVDVPYGEDPAYATTSTQPLLCPRGYTWIRDINRDTSGVSCFSVDYNIEDYRNAVAEHNGLHLKVSMLNDFAADEVVLAKGSVPVWNSNHGIPEALECMIVRRNGENLSTLFTAVYEPYKNEAYIVRSESVPITVEDGTEESLDEARAVRVTLASGRVDYIVYATNNNVRYRVDNRFDFRGFVGMYSENAAGENIYTYINDGDVIGNTESESAYTGTVQSFTDTLKLDNSITLAPNERIDIQALAGKYIYIDNDGVENGAYKILGAVRGEGGAITLALGNVSLIRKYADSSNFSQGFMYNIRAGQNYRIPLGHMEDASPIFDEINALKISAKSMAEVTVKAKSPLGKSISFSASTLPRGASFEAASGKFKWKPQDSQIGKNLVCITATDEDGRAASLHFYITVLGATTGNGNGELPPSQGSTGEKPQGDVKEEASGTVQTDDVFVDIAGCEWARDAIESLAADGIIKGVTTTQFAPGANIRRADFAILIVRAFGLSSDGGEQFDDVPTDAYFADEVRIARASGIIGGVGKNAFKPYAEITRQDMMLILVRLLKMRGASLRDIESCDMTDYGETAEYAKDAVKTLVGNGLITGADGRLNPHAQTTRAETAVIIWRIRNFK